MRSNCRTLVAARRASRLLSLLVVVAVFSLATSLAEEIRARSALEGIRRDTAKRHVAVLADDTFEGREAGSRGGRAASVYLGKEFEKYQLEGAGTAGGYYQAFGANYRNILAKLEGSDPELKQQYILIGAHYDHVGYGTAQNSYGPTGYIHNGADDNASGTAALLEVAKALAQAAPRPRRTIVFALWDAEEKGLLGSKHWLSSPTLPLKDLVLAANMDMVGRVRNDRLEVVGTRTARGLRRLVSEHNRDTNLLLDFTWEMADNSDHHPFFVRGVPILMFHSGLHSDYHRPSDDVERIDEAGIERAARLLFSAVYDLANRDESPTFRAASRREDVGQQRASELPAPPLPSRLGVRWDTNLPGVIVANVEPGSPAERAGLRRGDQIQRLGGVEAADGEALRALVAVSDNATALTVLRGTETVELPIQLRGGRTRIGIAWRTDDAQPGCVVVTRVTPGSPAARADLRPNDVIYQIDGRDFVDSHEFQELAVELPLPFELLVERRGRIERKLIDALPAAARTSVEPGPSDD